MNAGGRLLDRTEKATSVVRNIVLLLAGIISIYIFLADTFGRVTATAERRVVSGSITGSKFLVTDRDRFSEFLQRISDPRAAPAAVIREYQKYFGRLDRIGIIWIRNESRKPVHLLINVFNEKRPLLDPPNVDQGEFMRTSLVLVDVWSACPLQSEPLTLGSNGWIGPGMTGTLEIREFPVGCFMNLQLVDSRAPNVIVTIFADGRLVTPTIGDVVYGKVGRYAASLDTNPPWSYILRGVFPAVLLILAVLAAAQWLSRRV